MAPSALPDGDPAPPDGMLPAEALADLAAGFSAYVHVPFCASRCGYCDFNTYTASELGDAAGSVSSYLDAVAREVDLAGAVLSAGAVAAGPLQTVFFGGGTPTLLSVDAQVGLLGRLRDAFGLVPGAEVTTEANPDSVTPESLAALRAGGVTRISFGMQSVVPHVLATLDRTHTPGRALAAVGWAREAGFESVSVDLIYGSPGETVDEWRATIDATLAVGPDHVSAYSLIVEEGTPLARRIARGELAAPDEDLHADFYLVADEALSEAGYGWYEVSNWARPGHECRHNLAYWTGRPWWGFGPGAHSHVGGVRWWNVKHPRTYAQRLAAGAPAAGRETLTASERRVERVLLELRLATGLPLDVLTASEAERVPGLLARGLAEQSSGRLRLTLRGRLLADAVVRDLLD